MTNPTPLTTSFVARLRTWARGVKSDVVTIYFAARDPRAPMSARVVALMVAAYALSPIDLIPDFIPVLGYLDDVLIVPLGVLLVLRLMPDDVLVCARSKADAVLRKPRSMAAAFVVVLVWLGLFIWMLWA